MVGEMSGRMRTAHERSARLWARAMRWPSCAGVRVCVSAFVRVPVHACVRVRVRERVCVCACETAADGRPRRVAVGEWRLETPMHANALCGMLTADSPSPSLRL